MGRALRRAMRAMVIVVAVVVAVYLVGNVLLVGVASLVLREPDLGMSVTSDGGRALIIRADGQSGALGTPHTMVLFGQDTWLDSPTCRTDTLSATTLEGTVVATRTGPVRTTSGSFPRRTCPRRRPTPPRRCRQVPPRSASSSSSAS